LRSRSRGCEAVAEQGQQAGHLIGRASGVGVVFDDAQAGLMLQKAVQDMRRLRRGRRDDLGLERPELVGDVGVERDAGLVAPQTAAA
jgi:hypothetical protein